MQYEYTKYSCDWIHPCIHTPHIIVITFVQNMPCDIIWKLVTRWSVISWWNVCCNFICKVINISWNQVWSVFTRLVWINQFLKETGQADASSHMSSKLMGHHLSSGCSLAKKDGSNRSIYILANNSMEPLSPQHSRTPSSQQERGTGL